MPKKYNINPVKGFDLTEFASPGDITGVIAGTGLTGGGTTGDVTLSADTTFLDTRYLKLTGGTMTGDILGAISLGSTGTRLTKGWFTDLQVTNAIAGSVTGSAATLTIPRAINGVNFDGSAPITVTADANTLSNTTLKSTVVTSSLTSVGTLTGLTVNSPTITLSQDTNFVLSGGVNGVSFNTNTLSIDATNGRVGIGTVAPGTLLHVYGSADAEKGLTVTNANTAGTAGSSILNFVAGSTVTQIVATNESYNTQPTGYGSVQSTLQLINRSGPILFKAGGFADASEWVRITTAGNVGIGTTGPNYRLEVLPSYSGGGISVLEADGGNVAGVLRGYNGGGHLDLYAAGVNTVHIAGNGGAASWFNDGNVGIGTTGPLAKLDVRAASGASVIAYFLNNDYASLTTGSGLLVRSGATSGNTYMKLDAVISGGNNYGNLVLNAGGGNVGIGTTGPTAKLHLPACAAGANLASLKIPPGTVATTAVSGNIESDGTNLYWTDSGGTRRQLNN